MPEATSAPTCCSTTRDEDSESTLSVIVVRNTRKRLATLVSIVGHPFTVVSCTIGLIVRPAWISVAVAVATVGALLAVIAWRVASGRWSDYDVSDPGERHTFYPTAIPIVGASALIGWRLGMPAGVVRGFFVAA